MDETHFRDENGTHLAALGTDPDGVVAEVIVQEAVTGWLACREAHAGEQPRTKPGKAWGYALPPRPPTDLSGLARSLDLGADFQVGADQ